jgi:hypothetical protein
MIVLVYVDLDVLDYFVSRLPVLDSGQLPRPRPYMACMLYIIDVLDSYFVLDDQGVIIL